MSAQVSAGRRRFGEQLNESARADYLDAIQRGPVPPEPDSLVSDVTDEPPDEPVWLAGREAGWPAWWAPDDWPGYEAARPGLVSL